MKRREWHEHPEVVTINSEACRVSCFCLRVGEGVSGVLKDTKNISFTDVSLLAKIQRNFLQRCEENKEPSYHPKINEPKVLSYFLGLLEKLLVFTGVTES